MPLRGLPTSIARLACAVVVLGGPAWPGATWAAGDDAAPTVRVDGSELPFSNEELDQAVQARVLPADAANRPAPWIEPADAGEVVVHVGDRSRVVAVADRTGPAAARVVALVIAELLSSTAPAPPAETAATDAAPSASPAPAATPTIVAADRAPGSPAASSFATLFAPGTRLSVTAGFSKGTGGDELAAGTADADLVLPLAHGRACLAPSLGLMVLPTRNAGTYDEVSSLAAVARLLGGVRFGPVDLLAGPFASSYSIKGATAASGVLFGGEVMARLQAPLSRHLRLVAVARGDAYGDRVRIHWVDGHTYATPRVGLSLGVGLGWEWPA